MTSPQAVAEIVERLRAEYTPEAREQSLKRIDSAADIADWTLSDDLDHGLTVAHVIRARAATGKPT